jgi:hypothetical protein
LLSDKERIHVLLLYTARREAHSLVEMVSEGVASASVIVVSRVIDVFSVGLSVWVAIRREVSIVGEEETVPCAMLLGLSVLLVTIGLILSLEHGSLSNVELILRDHSGEGLEVRASEPGILQNV